MSVDHKSRGHAKLGASSSKRWMACPASIRLSEGIPPEPSSPYAAEGTAAHELSEMAIEQNKDCIDFLGEEINGFKVTQEMSDYVQIYVDYIREKSKEETKEVSIEEAFDLSFVKEGMFGTNDACIYEPYGELEIIDLKYGRTEVEAKDNPQLKYYALGAIQGGDYDKVRLTIVQPRVKNPIKSVLLDVKEIEAFEKELREAADRTENPNSEMKIGDHCFFCPAKAICPAKKKNALAVVQKDFNAEPIDSLPDPDKLELKQITKILDNKDAIIDWLNSVHKHATLIAKADGNPPPDYKLVRKKTNRKIADPKKFTNDFTDILGDDMFDKKLKALSKLEKLVGKEEMKDYLIRPEGEIILVPYADKRTEISLADGKRDHLAKLGIEPLNN